MIDKYLETLTKTAAKQKTASTAMKDMSIRDLAKLAGIKLAENVCTKCGSAMGKSGDIYKCGCGMMKSASAISEAVDAIKPLAPLADDAVMLAQRLGAFDEKKKAASTLPLTDIESIVGQPETNLHLPANKDRLGEHDNTPKGELNKKAFSVTPEGHKYDAELARLKAEYGARVLELGQRYGAVYSPDKGVGSMMKALRGFSDLGPDPRHEEYVAKAHEEGRNAWNPFGGGLTPSSYETDGTNWRGGKFHKDPQKKEKEAAIQAILDVPDREAFIRELRKEAINLAGLGQKVMGGVRSAGNAVAPVLQQGAKNVAGAAQGAVTAAKPVLQQAGNALKNKGQAIAQSFNQGVHGASGSGSVMKATMGGVGNVIKQHPGTALTAGGAIAAPVAYGALKSPAQPQQQQQPKMASIEEVGDQAGRLLAKSAWAPTPHDIEQQLGMYLDQQQAGRAEQLGSEAEENSFSLRHPWLTGIPTLGIAPMVAHSNAQQHIVDTLMRNDPTLRRAYQALQEKKKKDEMDAQATSHQRNLEQMKVQAELDKANQYRNIAESLGKTYLTSKLLSPGHAGTEPEEADGGADDWKGAAALLNKLAGPELTPEDLQGAIEGAQAREDIEGRGQRAGIGGAAAGGLGGALGGGALGYGVGSLLHRPGLGATIGGAAGGMGGGVAGYEMGKQHGADAAAADRAVSMLRALRARDQGVEEGIGMGLNPGPGANAE
jgi:hypothetical protein